MMKKHRLQLLLILLLCLTGIVGSLCWLYANGYVQPPIPARSRLPILMYHHIVTDGTECNDMTITAGRLEQDLKWLTDNGYTPILPKELAAGDPLPERPVMITFDDGYRSNYELAYPLLQKYQAKAAISIIVCMQELHASEFLSWDMCREMAESGLVEIGSHTYGLHNLGDTGGRFLEAAANGIQRRAGETDEEFDVRVLQDLRNSHARIEACVGQPACFFAYPYGLVEPDAQTLLDELFPVSVITYPAMADLRKGLRNMPRQTVTMTHDAETILTENQWIVLAGRIFRKIQRTLGSA